MIIKVIGEVSTMVTTARRDGGLVGLRLLIDGAVRLMQSARVLERQLHASHPSASEQWSAAAKLLREDAVSLAATIDQNLLASACSKVAAASSMRALRMAAEIPHLRKKAAQAQGGGASSASSSSKDKDYMSEPVRLLQAELLSRIAEGGGALSLPPDGARRVDTALQQLLEFSFAIEGHDFGLRLDRAAHTEDHHPLWLRSELPALDDFATLDSKQLVDLGSKLHSLVARLEEKQSSS
jgi:hypothetical protein